MFSHPIYGKLIKQGAEAHVYKSTYITAEQPCLVKVRPIKKYRHAILDSRLTKHRCISEARLLSRCRSMGISCPTLYFVDEAHGEIVMEWVNGNSIRDTLEDMMMDDPGNHESVKVLMQDIGQMIGKLHSIDVVHGDLTTSNLLLRDRSWTSDTNQNRDIEQARTDRSTTERYEIVVIDFGLGQVSTSEEDKAVDLYVLERAFSSTHPKVSHLFDKLLEAYQQITPASSTVLKKLREVRLRGRKKSMLG